MASSITKDKTRLRVDWVKPWSSVRINLVWDENSLQRQQKYNLGSCSPDVKDLQINLSVQTEMQVPQLGLFIPEFEAQLGCSRDPGCQPGTCDFLGTGESLSGCSENAGLNFGRSTLVSSC